VNSYQPELIPSATTLWRDKFIAAWQANPSVHPDNALELLPKDPDPYQFPGFGKFLIWAQQNLSPYPTHPDYVPYVEQPVRNPWLKFKKK
jgi:hypothetical protein